MILDMKYFDVYYFCHLSNNSMGKFGYARNHGEFVERQFEDLNVIIDFPRTSVLREYCFWLVESVIWEQANLMSQGENKYDFNPFIWISQAIEKYHNIHISHGDWFKINGFTDKDDDYYDIFSQFAEFLNNQNNHIYSNTIECIALEVEYILFQNRDFLLRFNLTMAPAFEEYNRPRAYIPEWVKRAVLFRDKGCCVFCKKDLTGLYTLLEDNQKQFDHIVPLVEGGANDVCNIQLTCQQCNSRKKDASGTSSTYQSSY